MNPITFKVPRQHPPRRARPGVDVPVAELQQMIDANQVGSFIACQHPETPLPDRWCLYVMGQASDTNAGNCLGIVTAWADRPLAFPSMDDVVELMLDVGWDGLLQVAAEPVPLED